MYSSLLSSSAVSLFAATVLAAEPVPKLWSKNSVTISTNSSTNWPSQNYVSTNVTPSYLEINATGEPLEPGLIFYTPTAGVNAKAFISRLGPVISTDTGDLVWAGPISGDASNFKVQSLYGEPVLSFWEGTGAAASGLLAGHGYGQVNIYNTSYDQIATVCPKLNITKPPGQNSDCDADVHESYITDYGTILLTAYNVTNADLTSIGGPKNGYVYDTLAFEVDIRTGDVLFSWSPLQHVSLNNSKYPLSGAGNSTANAYDFFHINAIFPFEGGFLINSRHTWSTYFVDRSGNIVWQIQGSTGGDFGAIPAGGSFAWQHNSEIRRTSPTQAIISWFANNNDIAGQTNTTTGVELLITLPPNKSTPPKLLSNVTDPGKSIFSSAEGSHQIFTNGDHFLGYGFQPYIKYFGAGASNGSDIRWSARYAYDNNASSYRAFKQEWHAVPSTAPVLVVKKSNETTGSYFSSPLRGYVSWNGATDVDFYNFYAGSGNASLALAGVFGKEGFETEFYVPSNGATAYQVGAVVNGTEVKRSAVVSLS